MIACQVTRGIPHGTVQAQICIALEKRSIVQWRHILVAITVKTLARAVCRNDRIDIYVATGSVEAAVAAVDSLKTRPTVVRDLLGVVVTYRFAVVYPLERHSSHVGSENLL